MSLKPAKVQFNGGELSPWLDGRTDIAQFDKTAKLCRNFIPMAEGSLKRRGGTRFVAETANDEELLFKIVAVPEEALVLIDGRTANELKVARGDKVNFEVSADGYSVQSGSMVVLEDTVLEVRLVSKFVKTLLTINPKPEDAEVRIDGIVRKQYEAPLNKEVMYMVSKNGYVPVVEKVVMTEDKEISVSLDEVTEEENGGVYGSWGIPLYFVSCTVVGEYGARRKCFLFRFTNGYLALLFDGNLLAPTAGQVERLFWPVTDTAYDSVAYSSGHKMLMLTRIQKSSDGIRYKDDLGYTLFAVSNLEQMVTGWPIDEYGHYASIYTLYSGSVVGTVGYVYYKGELVWKLVGDY